MLLRIILVRPDGSGKRAGQRFRYSEPALACSVTVDASLAGEGSNLQPPDPKSGVLPVELPATGPCHGTPHSPGDGPTGRLGSRHGIADQEAPQAHAQEEAQEDAESDPLAAARR